MRVVLRRFGIGVPYSWYGFATRFKAGDVVGADFFEKLAKDEEALFIQQAKSGLMDSFDTLQSKDFNPFLVNPMIKDFYENTYRYDMEMKIWWNPLIKPFGKFYRLFYANRIKQTMIPMSNREFKNLDSWIETIDKDHDYVPEFRCWIRILRETKEPVYVGAYRIFKSNIDNYTDAYISVSFPIPKGSITTVLSPFNYMDDGLKLTTVDEKSTESGLYLIFPGKNSYTMIPAFGLNEEFNLVVKKDKEQGSDESLVVEHTCFWLGFKAFKMNYVIKKKNHSVDAAS